MRQISILHSDIRQAVFAISSGECIIYPTETVYALGSSVFQDSAVKQIFVIKERSEELIAPTIVGSFEQVSMLTSWSSRELVHLATRFWPGPLSVLVPADRNISPLLCNKDGYCAVRISSNSIAKRLCLEAGTPLVATSANISGLQPASLPDSVSPEIKDKVRVFLQQRPWPRGGHASTIIKLHSGMRFSIIRKGAVTIPQLLAGGFSIHDGQ